VRAGMLAYMPHRAPVVHYDESFAIA